MGNNKNSGIVYATYNADLFIKNSYIPDSLEKCKESFSKSLNVLVGKVCKYTKSEKSFPQLLILKDHVAVNIALEYFYFFEKELQEKLSEEGFIGMKVSFISFTSSQDSAVKHIREYYPDYKLDTLIRNREVEYMEPDDERQFYLIYKLENDPVAEKEYFIKEEKRIREMTKSSQWDNFYNIVMQAPGQTIKDCYAVKFPEFLEDEQVYEIILSSGKISKATIGSGCTWSHSDGGLEWIMEDGRKLGGDYSFLVIAWKKIIQV